MYTFIYRRLGGASTPLWLPPRNRESGFVSSSFSIRVVRTSGQGEAAYRRPFKVKVPSWLPLRFGLDFVRRCVGFKCSLVFLVAFCWLGVAVCCFWACLTADARVFKWLWAFLLTSAWVSSKLNCIVNVFDSRRAFLFNDFGRFGYYARIFLAI